MTAIFPPTVIVRISEILTDNRDYRGLYNFLNLNKYHQRIFSSSTELQHLHDYCLETFLDDIFWLEAMPITQAICDYAVVHAPSPDRWFPRVPPQFLNDLIVEIVLKEDYNNLRHIHHDDVRKFLHIIEDILFHEPDALEYIVDTRVLSSDVLKSLMSRNGMLLRYLDCKPNFLTRIAIANNPRARQYNTDYNSDGTDDEWLWSEDELYEREILLSYMHENQ